VTRTITSTTTNSNPSNKENATMAKRTSKSLPNLDADILILVGEEADDEAVVSLIEQVEEVLTAFDGHNLRVVADLDLDDDSDEEDEDEEDEEGDEEDDDAEDEEEEDEDDDEEESDEDEPEEWSEEELAEADNDTLKSLLDYWEVEVDGRFSSKKAIAAILEAQAEHFGEEADEDEDDEEEVELDEDALNEMSLKELKEVYEQVVEEKPARGMKKDALIEGILEMADE
jgi:hypothetical protein